MKSKKKKFSKLSDFSRRSSITEAFLKNNKFLKNFLSRYFNEQCDIEDIMQEAYLRAYGAEKIQEIKQPKPFLFQIAKNIAINELNKKSRQLNSYIDDFDLPLVLESETQVENEIEAKQQFGLYCEAVATLPVKCRRIFLLRKVHGLSHKEISQRVGLTVSSVEKYLLKATLTCRKYVQEHEKTHSAQMPDSAGMVNRKGNYT